MTTSYDALLHAITADIIDGRDNGPAVVVTSFVAVASFMDEHGERHIYSNTMEDQRCHESLGLLAFATAIENDRAVSQRPLDDD